MSDTPIAEITTATPQTENYLVRIGHVAMVREQTSLPPLERGALAATKDFISECAVIERLLRNSRFVEDVQPPKSTVGFAVSVKVHESQGIAPYLGRGVFTVGFYYPRQDQGLPEDYTGVVLERFVVLYNGVAFCVIAQFDGEMQHVNNYLGMYRYDWIFVDRIRALLVEALSGEPGFRPVVISPDDIDLQFRFAISDDSTVTEPQITIHGLHPDVEVRSTLPAGSPIYAEAYRLAFLALRGCSTFYQTMHMKARRDALLDAMRSRIRDVSNYYSSLLTTSWWQFWQRLSLLKEMRTAIGEASLLYVEATDVDISLSDEIVACEQLTEQNTVLSSGVSYFNDHMKRPVGDMGPILRVLQFYEDETRSTLTSSTAASIALLAIVASVATSVLIQVVPR